jgi:cobalt-zinc-cadmium efflux system membrane fusion protein
MFHRLSALAVGLVSGIVLAWTLPGLPQLMPALTASPSGPSQAPKSVGEAGADVDSTEGRRGFVRLTPEAIAAAGIDVAEVRSGAIARRISVPGTIAPHADRIAHVAVKLPGIVAELRKNIGDPVGKDEIAAILESREVADAKSEYLAARLANELQQDLFERDQALWDKRISSEQQFLRSRNEAARTKMRNDIARQKLFALGLAEMEIASLPSQPEATLRRQEIRSPIAGHVVERKVELGVVLGRDNLETELYVIADLDRVWAELAVSPEDAPLVHIGQPVVVAARGGAGSAEGKVIFIGPILDKTTRSARVVAEIGNQDGMWRPGSFVTAAIVVEQREVPLVVPAGAIQTIGSERVAFVRTSDGFQKRPVVLRRGDDRAVEVLSGLRAGETIAVSNTFLLKAEMLKGSAED